MFDFSGDALMFRLMMLVPLILSLTVHEWAHAYSAWKLGDDTAASQGRLTLDPLVHMDPLGTFLLPLLGIPFGWAKPVPVNPARFRRDVSMRFGMALTAFAGPLSNFVIATAAAISYGLLLRFAPLFVEEYHVVPALLLVMIPMNVGLGIFNLLPIPPLDGSRIVDWAIPYRFQSTWEGVHRFAPFLLIGVLAVGGMFLAAPIAFVTAVLNQLIEGIAL